MSVCSKWPDHDLRRRGRGTYVIVGGGTRQMTVAVIAILAATAFTACGSTSKGNEEVVRVGDTGIARGDIAHWAAVLAVGASPSGRSKSLRERALSQLIARQWIIGEAAEEHQAVGQDELERRLRQSINSFSGGEQEFREVLKLKGESYADVALETRATLAKERVDRRLRQSYPTVSPAEVARYYDQHRREFVVSEARQIEVVSRASRADATQARREAEAGRPLANQVGAQSLVYTDVYLKPGSKPYARAMTLLVRRAHLHELSGPFKIAHRFFVFVLNNVAPARLRPLAAVSRELAARLARRRWTRTTASFYARWGERWKARTECMTDLVVPQCRQYNGRPTAYERVWALS